MARNRGVVWVVWQKLEVVCTMSERLLTRWEELRDLVGLAGSRQRFAIEPWLENRLLVLFWGDSWFSLPMYDNLAVALMQRIDGLGVRDGRPGRTAAQLFAKRSVRKIERYLEAYPFDLAMVSAGGNDALGKSLNTWFRPWLEDSPPARLSPEAAFDRLFDPDRQGSLIRGLKESYRRMLNMAADIAERRAHFRLIAHSYFPPVSIGKPLSLSVSDLGLAALLVKGTGPWLWEPMRHVLDDRHEDLHQAVTRFGRLLILEGFIRRLLEPLEQHYSGLFHWVDFTALEQMADESQWHDEIHPTEHGFRVMARAAAGVIRPLLPDDRRQAIRD